MFSQCCMKHNDAFVMLRQIILLFFVEKNVLFEKKNRECRIFFIKIDLTHERSYI